MATSKAPLEQIILRSVNPFDPSTFKPGNFWQEDYQEALEVPSIHRDVLQKVEAAVDEVAGDRITRTILLAGDSGSGKSYLLGRMKQQLNDRAFFVYIGPWADSDYIWRHTLRNTVDSLTQTPEGKDESQLLLWLNQLLALQKQKKSNWLAGGRKGFVDTMMAAYPAGLYNRQEFFGVLYALTVPDLFYAACDWLRGDDIHEDDLKKLSVKRSVDSEDTAQKVLSNFGRIAEATLPIVLCFDQLDNIPKVDGKLDMQALMNVNTTLHNEKLKNFLVLISVITDSWRQVRPLVQASDLARIGQTIQLKPISLRQAEELWAARLHPLHQLASPKPKSAIAPLTRDWLETKFPGGKTLPRTSLVLGQKLIEHFNRHSRLPTTGDIASPDPKIESQFKLVWDKELGTVKQQIARLRQFSSPELIQRLREALEALGMEQIQTSILGKSKYSANSLQFHNPTSQKSSSVGVVWSEESNMSTFFHVMQACKKVMDPKTSQPLLLVRAESVGQTKNKGNQIYHKLFNSETHLKPSLDSLHILETYHKLMNSACSHELVLGQTKVSPTKLQKLTRTTEILMDCILLKELLNMGPIDPPPVPVFPEETIKKYVLNIINTQHILGRVVLFQNAKEQFSGLDEVGFDRILQEVCETGSIQIVNPNAKLEEQLICLVPS